MKQRGFYPTEIIFAATNACNLHCKHCYIDRNPCKLDINQAIKFVENCMKNIGETASNNIPLPKIERIGFSGGEPFLYMDFLIALIKTSIKHDLIFDQIMTNGDWYKTEEDLRQTLKVLYDAGYDGKIGLSWDSYHGQDVERMQTFIKNVQEIFGNDSINVQSVYENNNQNQTEYSAETVPVYKLPRTYPANDKRAWQSKHWFREDYCEGPGHILYVHANGNIAPCCGFANENPALCIGRITDSLETIMKNAKKNKMINICFKEGLSHYKRHDLRKLLRKNHQKLEGRTSDICTFCDYVCSFN